MTTNKHNLKRALYVSISTIALHVNCITGQNVGINSTGAAPNASAMLDVASTTKGLLIPRVSLSSTGSNSPIGAGVTTSLLVYNTATAGDVTPGYYYWDGSAWVRFVTGSSSGWALTGNASTTDGTHFIGTTDNVPFNIRVNNQKAGRVDNTGNVFLGYRAGDVNVNSAGYNTGVGYQALYSNTTGESNVALGYLSLHDNTTGNYNTAIGNQVLYKNTTGLGNTSIGFGNLFANTTGNYNVALGYAVMTNNTTGLGNTGLGVNTLFYNTGGTYNTASGIYALNKNVNGSNNTGIGIYALFSNTDGNYNTAQGSESLYSNTVGSNNTALGYQALYFNTIDNNNAVGCQALYSNTTGTMNTAMGFQSLYSNTTGFSHTAIGHKALYSCGTNWQNTAVGTFAGYSSTGNGNCFFGHNAGYYMTNTAASIFGYQAAQTATGAGVTAVGYQAIWNFPTVANNVTAIGSQCALTANFANVGVYGGAAAVNANNKTRMGDAAVAVYETQVAWTVPSDGRFKNSVTENVPGLEFIKKLRPVTYKFDTEKFDKFLNGDKKYAWERDFTESKNIIHTGFIAQEVEQAAKECGYTFDGVHAPTNPTDNYGVAYSQFVMPLIKAVQEQQHMIEQQQKTADKQQNIIDTQQKLMLEMKQEIELLKKK